MLSAASTMNNSPSDMSRWNTNDLDFHALIIQKSYKEKQQANN